MNLQKSLTSPKTLTVALLMTAFYFYHLSSLSTLAGRMDVKVSPWVFTHMFSQICFVANGFFMTALFSDLPNRDRQIYFVVIRSGRRNWLWGQVCSVITMAFLYTVFTFLLSIVALIPNVQFTTQWGSVLKTLAVNRNAAAYYGTVIDFSINESILSNFTAIGSTCISLGLFWLTTVFAGSLILCANAILKTGGGTILSGLFACMCFFAYYGGQFLFGSWISYFSPYSWATMYYLNWGYAGMETPTPAYAVGSMLCASMLLCFLFIIVLSKRDVDTEG